MRTWPSLEVQPLDPHVDDLLQAFLLDFAVDAVDDTVPGVSRIFFRTPGERDRAAASLHEQFPRLTARPVDVPDDDWAAKSQASLHAIRVGDLVVAPPWNVPPAEPGVTVVVIQPSMGFGTGHHATTRLCLAALQRTRLDGCRVLDVGTGSGVLAIASRLLGASAVVAIDDDADAVASAEENVALNAVSGVDVRMADLRASDLGLADVVVANLTGGLLVATAARLRSLLRETGRLIVSGLMDHEERDVREAFDGLTVGARASEDEWVCLELSPARAEGGQRHDGDRVGAEGSPA